MYEYALTTARIPGTGTMRPIKLSPFRRRQRLNDEPLNWGVLQRNGQSLAT